MALERVRELYLTREVPADQLASVFDVSNAAMLNRLAGLLREKREIIAGQAELEESELGGPLARRPAEATLPQKQYDAFQQAALDPPTPALVVDGPGSGSNKALIRRA